MERKLYYIAWLFAALFVTEDADRGSHQGAEVGDISDVKSDQLPRDGRTDIRSEYDSDRLRQGHETDVDETDYHDCSGAAALQNGRDQSSHQHALDRRAGK